MRPKELQCVVTFHTTTQAMAFESASKDYDLEGRLIPIPTIISAGCGLAWRENPNNKQLIEQILSKYNIGYDKIYEIVI